jgi:hypothetical protein
VKKLVVSVLCAARLTAPYFSAVLASGCEKGQKSKVLLPPNLSLFRQAQSLAEEIWRSSPTFRLQCGRISQALWLRVKLSLVVKSAPTRVCIA